MERARGLVGAGPAAEAEAERLRAWLWERHPDVPRVRVLRADELARLRRWEEVRAVLAPCTGASFHDDEDHAQHFFHLLALASLHLDDEDSSAEYVTEAVSHGGSCRLQAISAVLLAKLEPGNPAREVGATALLPQLVWAVQEADARLDAGDPEGALAALDPRRFETRDELQVLARRAEAWLRLSPPAGPRRFAKIMALAELVEAHVGSAWRPRKDLPIPGDEVAPTAPRRGGEARGGVARSAGPLKGGA